MALDRTNFNAWVDDDASGTTGTILDKDAIDDAILTPIDNAIAGLESDGTDVTGLAFAATQVPSADVNTLDDYERGTWTPIIGGTGGQSGQAYSSQVGRYTKIGRLVFIAVSAQLSTEGTITGSAQISGLPF